MKIDQTEKNTVLSNGNSKNVYVNPKLEQHPNFMTLTGVSVVVGTMIKEPVVDEK